MTKREQEQQRHMMNALESLGFTFDERQALRRISMTLHRWHELECGDGNEWGSWSIERDENGEGPPFMVRYPHDSNTVYRHRIPDRETGARKRLAQIIARRNGSDYVKRTDAQGFVSAFVQTDPRGAALYILRPGDVPAGADPSAYYTRGICVY